VGKPHRRELSAFIRQKRHQKNKISGAAKKYPLFKKGQLIVF
jgi:hypothetical protein